MLFIYGAGVILCIFLIRVLFVMYLTISKKRHPKPRKVTEIIKTVIVIGSGGHTTEMLHIIKALNKARYSPRVYIMASSDSWSEQKIHEFEVKLKPNSDYSIIKIPRSRSVHQSYFTSILTSLYSILFTIPVMLWHNPGLLLCNGPGTCIPVCFIAFIMRCLNISNNVIIFIESICRVKSLSLSGKILLFLADEILVQWPELALKYKRAKYIGRA